MTIKKFLAIAFMCHQMPERSFFVCGKQLPLCARCSGILIGYIIGIVIAVITKCEFCLYMPVLILPLAIDGGLQYIKRIESNNVRRFFTGIMGGIAIINIFIDIHVFTVWWVKIFLEYIIK